MVDRKVVTRTARQTHSKTNKQAGRRTYLQGIGDGETHKTSGDVIVQHGEQRGKHHNAVA